MFEINAPTQHTHKIIKIKCFWKIIRRADKLRMKRLLSGPGGFEESEETAVLYGPVINDHW